MPWLWSCGWTHLGLVLRLGSAHEQVCKHRTLSCFHQTEDKRKYSINHWLHLQYACIHYNSHSGKSFTFDEPHSTGNKCDTVMLSHTVQIPFVWITKGTALQSEKHKADQCCKWDTVAEWSSCLTCCTLIRWYAHWHSNLRLHGLEYLWYATHHRWGKPYINPSKYVRNMIKIKWVSATGTDSLTCSHRPLQLLHH